MSIRLDVYRETPDGLVRAKHPSGEAVYAAGSTNMQATQRGAERLADECAAREPGETFVVIDRATGVETHHARVEPTQQAA